MKKYKILVSTDATDLEGWLNQYADEGYELVGYDYRESDKCWARNYGAGR